VVRPWLRNPLYDVLLLAFCWVPVYLWVVFGLGLGGAAIGLEPLHRAEAGEALALATMVVLGLTWIHRHYTFVLVYGDRATFGQRSWAYVLSPLIVFGTAVFLLTLEGQIQLFGASVRPFSLMLVAGGVWNIWHTIQQRYGILRAYAGKAGGSLRDRAHGRRDRILLWTLVVALAVALPAVRARTFMEHPNAWRVFTAIAPIVNHPAYWGVLAATFAGTAGIVWWWWRHEREASVDRLPRWIFLGSTIALLLVFVVHGPIVGYLCFGAAHALEYVAFVHNHAEKKWFGRAERGLASVLLGKPMAFAPILIAGFGLAFLAFRAERGSEVYLAYYIGSSMLHFLYDGWIWKSPRRKA